MKVLLVKPYNLSDQIQPSVGLGYLASSIRDRHEVRILDCIKERMDIRTLGSFVRNYAPDVLGLQCYTFDLHFVGKALRLVKEIDRDIVTILGGPHPTAAPKATMERFKDDLDFLFIGEAEIGLSRLLDGLKSGKGHLRDVPALAWREGGRVVTNPQVFVDDLDSLGMPAWDLIMPQDYPESQHGAFYKKFPVAPIMMTRGCPFSCTFCAGSVVTGKKVRKRSVDNVLKEILLLHDKFGINEFYTIDDNFTMDISYAKEFLRRLKALNLGMTWAVPNGIRMDTLDKEALRLMKETGLYMISVGIESGSDRILNLMKKSLTKDKIRRAMTMIDEAGIDIAGFFILGFPGDTEESIRDTMRFSLELPLKRVNFFSYLPLPGTESYRDLERKGELKGVDWDNFYFTNAAYVPAGLTRERLRNFQRLAFAKFYLRPHIIFYNILAIKSFRHLIFVMKRILRWMVFK